ncbi:MAG: AEC family transporter [Oscillospiraceae bacterium]|nr:AEC family transporter [Oscillospiraceae bacterium]
METLLVMLKNVIIFVLLAVPGYLLVRGKLLFGKESGTLSKLLTNVGMPFLILSSTLKLEFSGEFTKSIIVAGVAGVLFTVVMFLLSALVVRGETDFKRRGMMRFCMVFANNGFIGIPLARAVFGEESRVMAYLIILNIISNVLMFTLGVYLISGDKNTINVKKAVLNPVLISFVIGIILNVAGVSRAVPEVQTYATYFSNIVTPLSMVILGMKLAGVEFGRLLSSACMYYVSAMRLVIFPIMGVAVAYVLQMIPALSLNSDAVIGFFVAFAMPTAGLASAFSDQYEGDTDNAVIFTLGTTILSVATIPVLYWVLRLIV